MRLRASVKPTLAFIHSVNCSRHRQGASSLHSRSPVIETMRGGTALQEAAGIAHLQWGCGAAGDIDLNISVQLSCSQ